MNDGIRTKSGHAYITSSRAAQLSGYSQDYVGQLCRGESIECKRVSGEWQISLDTLLAYKQRFNPETVINKVSTSDTSLNLNDDHQDSIHDGDATYVSSSVAAKKTGYSQDYIGQLARSGAVSAKKLGRKWFIDQEALEDHKKHNDGLLAAVQANSAGVNRESIYNLGRQSDKSTIHTIPIVRYKRDDGSLVPGVAASSSVEGIAGSDESLPEAEVLSMPTVASSSRGDLRSNKGSKRVPVGRYGAKDIGSLPSIDVETVSGYHTQDASSIGHESRLMPKLLLILITVLSVSTITASIFAPGIVHRYVTNVTGTLGLSGKLEDLNKGYFRDGVLHRFNSITTYKKGI